MISCLGSWKNKMAKKTICSYCSEEGPVYDGFLHNFYDTQEQLDWYTNHSRVCENIITEKKYVKTNDCCHNHHKANRIDPFFGDMPLG